MIQAEATPNDLLINKHPRDANFESSENKLFEIFGSIAQSFPLTRTAEKNNLGVKPIVSDLHRHTFTYDYRRIFASHQERNQNVS